MAKVTSSLSIIFYVYLVNIIFGTIVAATLNMLLGCLFLTYSIMTSLINYPLYISGPLELASMIAFFGTGGILLQRDVLNSLTVALYKKVVVCLGINSFLLLLFSSFPTPLTKGYLPLIGSFISILATAGFAEDNGKKFYKTLTFERIIMRQLLPIAGIVVAVISPYFRNTFMYWGGVLILLAGAADSIKRRQATYLAFTVVMYIIVMIAGYFIQGKAFVIVGIGTVFVAINTLALRKFSGSAIFPFLITAFGLIFIYAGTRSENIPGLDDIMHTNSTQLDSIPFIVPNILDGLKIVAEYMRVFEQ